MSQSTRFNPVAKQLLVDRAVSKMRSDPFRALFPEEYVVQWEKGFRQAIIHEQLEPIIEANQVVQAGCRAVASDAEGPRRWLLETLRFLMRGLYFVMFRVMRTVVRDHIGRLTESAKRDFSGGTD